VLNAMRLKPARGTRIAPAPRETKGGAGAFRLEPAE
jgi:hypothetical protein